MKQPSRIIQNLRMALAQVFLQPVLLTFLPAMMLGWMWYGVEGVLWIAAVALPLVAVANSGERNRGSKIGIDNLSGLASKEGLLEQLRTALKSDSSAESVVVLVLEIDDFPKTLERLGSESSEELLRKVAERLAVMVRASDTVARLSGHRFGILIDQARQMDLEIAMQLAERAQAEISEPVSIDASTVYVTASVGFCLARRLKNCTPERLLTASETAMLEARRQGGNAIRSYTDEIELKVTARNALQDDVVAAFDNGQIIPWFQPQVCTDTGRISGFEALARWRHPERGMIPPSDFLEAVDNAGMMCRLGEVMLFHGLAAMRSWDRAGLSIDSIGVNFSSPELRNPKLVDKIRWDLDRFDITPDRLAIEVLETVVANAENDAITKNIASLANLGCTIDLDDFGTGHASISNIRRFAVTRIKIDRSFVTNIDIDQNQQRMVSAILLMAEQLGLKTLAEGVETLGEHAMLAQLGCNFIQGFNLSRPMPFEDTIAWIEKHNAKLAHTPQINSDMRKSG